ncbi:AAA family ATPase [Sphingobacterium sp. Mn56C]|uniref:AAA family ATPase n=1 Tax=Sphingobacterium sp. Mn56C TaxID=3395261 RepID=UPI003BCD9A2F
MSIIITNETLKQLFHIAQSIAKENQNMHYGASHLLQALMHREMDLRDFLKNIDQDPNYIYDWTEVRIEEYPKSVHLPTNIAQDCIVASIIEAADTIRLKLGLDEITPLCMLAALVKPNIAYTTEQLKSLPLREHEILQAFMHTDADLPANDTMVVHKLFTSTPKYAEDITAKAKAGKLQRIIGREKELRNLMEVLCRKSKPHVLIIGEPGVGKTALVAGLALEIVQGNVPAMLCSSLIIALDLPSLCAGTAYKSEIDDRLMAVLAVCKKMNKAIVFIDEIHNLLDEKGSAGHLGNLIKPELSNGEITVIGTTTQDEYRKIIERDKAFNRRFEVLALEEPNQDTCVKMMELQLEHFKAHHTMDVDKCALAECVRLAKRYAKGKKLPDAAIDLLDRTMAALKILNELSVKELHAWKHEFDQLFTTVFTDEQERIRQLHGLYGQLQNRISPILWGALKEQPNLHRSMKADAIQQVLEEVYSKLLIDARVPRLQVGKLELTAVMASITNIPIGHIQAQEKEKLQHMEILLRKRVVGQNHALKIVTDAIIENRSGLKKNGQPIGSFFFLGPTGTGKTELAKSIAELLFHDETAMIRYDMSEFKEEHAAALLYGAPPGYVGYEEGGLLVNKIRQQPYAVVLFDEIEKAHPSVFDLFLQIMDEGKIHDKQGKEGDFSHALILFTSNIGSQLIADKFNQNITPATADLQQIMCSYFRPEFLGRITEIVPFAPITEDTATEIFKIQVQTLVTALHNLGIHFSMTQEAMRNLAVAGFNSSYGARQISSVIRTQLTRPISKKILAEELMNGYSITVDWNNADKIVHWHISSPEL